MRVTAYVLKFVNILKNLRKGEKLEMDELTQTDMESAERHWIKHIQNKIDESELKKWNNQMRRTYGVC